MTADLFYGALGLVGLLLIVSRVFNLPSAGYGDSPMTDKPERKPKTGPNSREPVKEVAVAVLSQDSGSKKTIGQTSGKKG